MTTKRELAENAIKAHPDMSDREIARMIGVSHMTVGRARRPQQRPAPHYAPGTVLVADEAGQLVRLYAGASIDIDGKTYAVSITPTRPTRKRRTVAVRGN